MQNYDKGLSHAGQPFVVRGSHIGLLRLGEGLLEIGDQVVGMLQTGRDA